MLSKEVAPHLFIALLFAWSGYFLGWADATQAKELEHQEAIEYCEKQLPPGERCSLAVLPQRDIVKINKLNEQ